MSSRNRYLSPEDRARAGALPRLMQETAALIQQGADIPEALATLVRGLLAAGFSSVDYAELADADSLQPVAATERGRARLLVAARIGGTRLIDNMPIEA